MLMSLAKQLLGDIQAAVAQNGAAPLAQSQLKSLIERALQKCNLVSREEFDAQTQVLIKTRLKLQELEQQLAQLQVQLQNKS